MPEVDSRSLNDSLRRLHRSAIASLAVCALGIGVVAFAYDVKPPDDVSGSYSVAALALAAIAILLRRSGMALQHSLRSFVYGSVISMLSAVGLGLLGLYVALRESQTSVGLLYTLAGVLLVLRPPPTLVDRGRGEES